MVTYWVNHFPIEGVFPRWTISKSCEEYEVDGGNTFGYGFF
jgi:hypothetical protein